MNKGNLQIQPLNPSARRQRQGKVLASTSSSFCPPRQVVGLCGRQILEQMYHWSDPGRLFLCPYDDATQLCASLPCFLQARLENECSQRSLKHSYPVISATRSVVGVTILSIHLLLFFRQQSPIAAHMTQETWVPSSLHPKETR